MLCWSSWVQRSPRVLRQMWCWISLCPASLMRVQTKEQWRKILCTIFAPSSTNAKMEQHLLRTCSNIQIFRTSALQFHPLASSLCQPLPFRQKQGYSLCLPALMSLEYHTACRSTLKYLICPLWGVRVLAIYSLLQPVTQQVALVSLFECACVLAGTGIIIILYLRK